MKFFAQSALDYVCRQAEQQQGNGKMLFMMPSLPPQVVKDVADGMTSYCTRRPDAVQLIIKVATPLVQDWQTSVRPEIRDLQRELSEKGWCDDRENLTGYRNIISDEGKTALVLLIGVDRVTDAASMADFHHCDLQTVWERELAGSFSRWVRAALDARVGYEEDTIQHFDWVLQPLVERGLADVLQVSSLLQNLDLSAAQDGRDAERVLLSSLGRFGLPEFESFKFSTPRAFGTYLDYAIAFFAYDAFMEDRNRTKALKAIDAFVENNPLGEVFDPSERSPFASDQGFVDALREYIGKGDALTRNKLLSCDFVTIRDRILGFRAPREPKPKKETVSKLSGGPIEVALSALWTTLGEFKRVSNGRGVFAHEALAGIRFESRLFKHDCEGESAEERAQRAVVYLAKLLGGVDRYLEKWIDTTRMCSEGQSVSVKSELFRREVECQSARTSEPFLQFTVVLEGHGWDEPVTRQFAWRLPEIHPYRVADELVQWAADSISRADGYCLPVFHVPYYEELILAKDDEETRRVLLQCIHDEGDGVNNLLKARELDAKDPLLPAVQKLAFEYDRFMQLAKTNGIHAALLDAWDELRKAYEKAADAYLLDPACADSPVASMLFRAFLIIARRRAFESDRWVWDAFEPSSAVTMLHPALLEMLQAHIVYLLTAFSTIAGRELRSPGVRSFRESFWQGYVDLAAIQTPLSGLLKDRDRILDTDIRGNGLIHRIGTVGETEAPLTTRLLLRYDAFEEEDISDAELFRSSRESTLMSNVLRDYRKLHPHAEDGLGIAVYQNQDIQPVIAAVDEFLVDVCRGRADSAKPYAMSVTVFTESSDDSSVARWIAQWKERWEAAETQGSLAHYRRAQLSVAHCIVSSENHYRQFVELVMKSLDVDVAILNGFIRAGSQGNDFELVGPYDVTIRTLKFPILEKSFCSFRDPGRRLLRARVISNRQFRITTHHADVMARLKNKGTPQNTHYVVLGYGDYAPWQGVIDALHQRAEWVVCIDPNVDERLVAEKSRDTQEAREIIGFGSGVGTHGESNYTISTEQFRLSDVLHKLTTSIGEVYSGWSPDTFRNVAECVLAESHHLSGLSLVRATGIGQYVRDFMAYSLTRKLLKAGKDILCDHLVSLDAFRHWFDSAETDTRPDLLWLTAKIGETGRLHLDMRLIECKLAKMSDVHLDKAREQLENGLRHLVSVFMPYSDEMRVEDERLDQRYWWLQLHRLISSKSEIMGRDQGRILSALERLAEGEFDVEWRAAALTFWTDQNASGISQVDIWPYSVEGQEVGIGVVSSGSEFVRLLCEKNERFSLPWTNTSALFEAAAHPLDTGAPDDSGNGADEDGGFVLKKLKGQTPSELGSELSGVPEAGSEGEWPTDTINVPERILLGVTVPGSRKVYWEFGHSELNNRHILIFGSSGMGKTYTIQCLLFELGRNGQNSLIVDYTKGFFDNQLEDEFRGRLHPVQHIIRKQPLSINPFRKQAEPIAGELLPESASTTAQRVSGVFSEVYRFGDQQKSALYQAVKAGLEQNAASAMTLGDLIPRLEELVEQKGTVGQSASSVASKILPFIDQNPFGDEDPESWERLFTDTTHRCHIVQLAGFMKDAARLVTEFSLIDLYWFYRSRGTQHSPRVVVLDEVQNLDHREESPLAQLLREGRKFGFSLILATQIMSNLEKDEKDRLFNAAHKLFFRPADTEMRTYAEIASVSTGEKPDVWLKRLASLKKAECYSLGPSLNEATGKLEVKAFRIGITSLAKRTAHA
ncbi:AAA ATPase [uncultured Desulfobacterium sp.]|uniref:AAA ATPase n=1 Tax=uncultured Desulfobacterium sp. TaxID=201089 RepID=A0A445N0Y6_9BACT|nr:AAA ATPase [uncultured Desulfobacterium sp.]